MQELYMMFERVCVPAAELLMPRSMVLELFFVWKKRVWQFVVLLPLPWVPILIFAWC